jgi:replication-associated recombination protein RarA
MEQMEEFNFNSLTDVIETVKKYKNNRKRNRDGIVLVKYNDDLETLYKCLEPLKKLNNLIGMDEIKKNIIDQILFFSQELNTDEMMHTCLTGPPGVGKTTLGKILAEIYCSLGFLKTDNLLSLVNPERSIAISKLKFFTSDTISSSVFLLIS